MSKHGLTAEKCYLHKLALQKKLKTKKENVSKMLDEIELLEVQIELMDDATRRFKS